jgi:hypothetical protein
MSIDAHRRQIVFAHPALPESVDELRIRNLSLGEAFVDVAVSRVGGSVAVTVERRGGKIDVIVQS